MVAAVAMVPSTFARITKRVVLSTDVPTAERLLTPKMRSPPNGQALGGLRAQ